jgi:hypothetical protein
MIVKMRRRRRRRRRRRVIPTLRISYRKVVPDITQAILMTPITSHNLMPEHRLLFL